MDPTPTPADVPRILTFAADGGWVVVGLLVLFSVIGAGMTYAILYSARFPRPTMLTLTLSIITMALLGVYTLYGSSRSDVLPLASAALGALVASLTGAAGTKKAESEEEPPEMVEAPPPPGEPPPPPEDGVG